MFFISFFFSQGSLPHSPVSSSWLSSSISTLSVSFSKSCQKVSHSGQRSSFSKSLALPFTFPMRCFSQWILLIRLVKSGLFPWSKEEEDIHNLIRNMKLPLVKTETWVSFLIKSDNVEEEISAQDFGRNRKNYFIDYFSEYDFTYYHQTKNFCLIVWVSKIIIVNL